MSLKVCTSEFMLSTTAGVGLRKSWLPRLVNSAFLESTKDGDIERSPDPVQMIDGDLTWFNNSKDDQVVDVMVHRAPRSIVAQNPVTVIILDGWSFDIGEAPDADFPSLEQDWFGGKVQIDRPNVAAADLLFGRYFFDADDCQTWVHLGLVPAQQAFHFRYLCSVQTPGLWTKPSEFDARYEAHARWARLEAWAGPAVGDDTDG